MYIKSHLLHFRQQLNIVLLKQPHLMTNQKKRVALDAEIISIHINDSHEISMPPSSAIKSSCRSVLFVSRFIHITLTTNRVTTVVGMLLSKIDVWRFSFRSHNFIFDITKMLRINVTFSTLYQSREFFLRENHKQAVALIFLLQLYENVV